MKTHMKLIGLALLVCTFVCATCYGCGGQQSTQGSSSAQTDTHIEAASSNAQAPTSNPTSNSTSNLTSDAGDCVLISLTYNAGTGYEWVCAADPEGVVSETKKRTEDLTNNQEIAGGSLRDVFELRALKPGEVILTFTLERSWEKDSPAETQVYAFKVDENLKMTINPYKSNFDREPEWASNS